jgi:hypothetical protein
MWKSFSYDQQAHEFIIARNVVGDFGLHLSLIRSVSWGNNIPVESPFYPGVPMPYHYAVDVLAGLLERAEVRIDIALNAISAIACTLLLYIIYKLPQRIFGKNRFVGVVSVLLFIFHSSLTFVDFFKGKTLSFSLLKDIWRIPNYIHAGPFDGSVISTFFTLNVFVNQRHTVAALAIGLWIVYELISVLFGGKHVKLSKLLALGALLGVLGWVHTLLFAGFCFVVFALCVLYRKFRYIIPLLLPAVAIFIPHAVSILQVTHGASPAFFNPGFLSARPFTWQSFFYYWWLNLGPALFLILLGFVMASKKQKLFFIPFIVLFVITNTFQLSYRIDHNHTIINLCIIIANLYTAWVLWLWWRKGIGMKIAVVVLILMLTLSGILDIMVIKNDYQLRVADAPKNQFMQWIRTYTPQDTIFLSKQEILDPVTLSGRKNYVGHDYYLSVMGYDYQTRLNLAGSEDLEEMKKEGITYIVLPKEKVWQGVANPVYKDDTIAVYKL